MGFNFFRGKNRGDDEDQVGIRPPSSSAKFTPFTTTLSPCPWLYTPEEEEDKGGEGKEEDEGDRSKEKDEGKGEEKK